MGSFRAWLDMRRNWWVPPGLPGSEAEDPALRPATPRMKNHMDRIAHVECIREVREVGDTTVVQLAGEVDMRQTPQAHPALTALCERQPQRLVVNLEKVTFLDSSGLGMLIDVFRRIRGQGGRLVLCHVPRQVMGILEITRLDKFFTLYATEAEALSG